MEKELRTNAVNMSQAQQYELRKSIIRLSKSGKKNAEIAEILDVSLRHVQSTKKQYREGGITAIRPKTRGRREGEKRTLTPDQEQEIQRIIVEKTPDQLRFKECMWTRSNIQSLIKEKYKLDIPLSTLGYYLERWGFSVQRPVKRAYKQDEERVKNWMEIEYPGISERAKAENAEIYFGDETGLQNQATCLRGYAPIGQTPVVRAEAKHIKINMLSAISKRGKLRFMLYKDKLNSDLKRGIGKRPSPRSEKELEHNVRSHLKSVQLRPDKIIGFFGAKTTFYAA